MQWPRAQFHRGNQRLKVAYQIAEYGSKIESQWRDQTALNAEQSSYPI